MKGIKLAKQDSVKNRIKELEVALQNTQMALQVSQMMIKHLTDQFKATQNDVANTMGMLNDFQYRTLAMLEVGNFSKDAIDAQAEVLKLKDFNDASIKEDIEKGYLDDEAGVVAEDSVIVITSRTPGLEEDQGIFRSKFPMAECLTPALRNKILGLKLNDKVSVELGGTTHEVSILSIKKLKVANESVTEKEG
jgi:uncharacterized coiled-coil protein SlyX